MTLPTRPVASAVVETDWGQAVHDYTFAPAGCRVSGGTVTAPNSHATVVCPIDTALDDPGGYVDISGDRIVIPTGAEGLFTVSCRMTSTSGTDGTAVRGSLWVNGSEVTRSVEDCNTGLQITITLNIHIEFVAGDIVTARATKLAGTGDADPLVGVVSLSLVRLGAEYGA